MKDIHRFSCKIPDILVRFLTKPDFSRKTFDKYSNIKFHENPIIGTDGHDEANICFTQVCQKRLRIQLPKFRILSCPVLYRNADGRHSGVMYHTYVVLFYFEQTAWFLCRLIGSGESAFYLWQGCNKSEWRPSQSNVGFQGDRLNVIFFLLFSCALRLHLFPPLQQEVI